MYAAKTRSKQYNGDTQTATTVQNPNLFTVSTNPSRDEEKKAAMLQVA
jgi:hypothetical protein